MIKEVNQVILKNMKNPFESIPNQEIKPEVEFTKEERIKARKRHPNPRSIIKGPIEEMPGRIRNKIDHRLGDSNQNWLEKRAEIMADRSGANEVIENFGSEEIRIVDVGGGKGHIMREIIKSNPDKEIKIAEIDLSDYASEKVSESKEGEKMDSVFGEGENMPIKDKSVEIAAAYFTFQELDNDQQNEILEEIKRVIKDNGRIIIVDEPPQEKQKGVVARSKNILRNLKVSKFNLHSDEEWKKFFEENGLEVENFRIFGDDKENEKKQFISYVLKKAEQSESVERV